MNHIKTSQSGFTLVELIVVIVLLGILGVTALGKFQDLSGDAELAAVQGVAAELSSASSINYAKGLVGTPDVTITSTTGADIDTSSGNVCSTIGDTLDDLFQTGVFPSGYKLVSLTSDACSTANGSYTCTVYDDKDGDDTKDADEQSATATILCTGV